MSAEEKETSVTDVGSTTSDVERDGIPCIITCWSGRRSAYPFAKYFSESVSILNQHSFDVTVYEVDKITKDSLSDTHLLWLQGGETAALQESEQQIVSQFIQKGGTLLADAFYPPTSYKPAGKMDNGAVANRLRVNCDAVLSLFGLEGMKDGKIESQEISERKGYCNKFETYFRAKPRSQISLKIGPWLPIFEPDYDDESIITDNQSLLDEYSKPMRTAYLPRGTYGLGQVLLVSNMHCVANENVWTGGLIRRNEAFLLNLVATACYDFPTFFPLCRRLTIDAATKGDLSTVIRSFKPNQELERYSSVYRQIDEDDDDVKTSFYCALHAAAAGGYCDIIEFLVQEQNVPVDFQQPDMETALHTAAREGCITSVKYLVERLKADVRAPNKRGHWPIHAAARSNSGTLEGKIEVIQYFVSKGINVESASSIDGSTPFFVAVASHTPNISMITFLANEMKVGINCVNRDGWHPLLVAANNHDDPTVIKLLVEWGINPYHVRLVNERQNALHRAILNGHLTVARYLCENFPNLLLEKDVNDYSCLHFAARGGHVSMIEYMLTQAPVKVDPLCTDKHGKTALHVAAIHDQVDVLNYLLQMSPKLLNLTALDGWTALCYAARANSTNIIHALLEHADINSNARAFSPPHDTALTIALKHARWDAVRIMIASKNIDITLADDDGWTPLHLAMDKNATSAHECPLEIIVSLFQRGANPHVPLKQKADGSSWTPLTLASHWGRKDVVSYLLSVGPGGRSSRRKENN